MGGGGLDSHAWPNTGVKALVLDLGRYHLMDAGRRQEVNLLGGHFFVVPNVLLRSQIG